MYHILEKLSNGNLNLGERGFKQNSAYGEMIHKLADKSDVFLKTLDSDQKLLYEELSDIQYNVQSMSMTDQFIYGFRLGLLIALEISNVSDDYMINGM